MGKKTEEEGREKGKLDKIPNSLEQLLRPGIVAIVCVTYMAACSMCEYA